MESPIREALLVSLTDAMRAKGSWCGETHLQKATYFLQEMTAVPTGFDYILFHHGPFSFDLREELTAMRANGFLTLQVKAPPYGPSFLTTQAGEQLQAMMKDETSAYGNNLRFTADWLGVMKAADLERVATAFYVMKDKPDFSKDDQAAEVNRLKPHITSESALEAIAEVERKRAEWSAAA